MIVQKNRPIAFFSRKLNSAQQKYSVTEQELLSIIETLKEFKGMLLGQRIRVFTDHKNLIREALGQTSDRVYRWRMLLEEFGPEIEYIKGVDNTVADALSRLDYNPEAKEDSAALVTSSSCAVADSATDPHPVCKSAGPGQASNARSECVPDESHEKWNNFISLFVH